MKKASLFAISVSVAAALIFAGVAMSRMSKNAEVSYPEGYRGWTHVKSMVIEKGHSLYETFGGIHHVYANDIALKAMKSGKPYPDGSVLIFDLLEAKHVPSAITEGSRKVLGVMEKNAKKFAGTGGWGFQGFKGDTRDRAVTDGKAQCFQCHTAQKTSNYVFSTYRK